MKKVELSPNKIFVPGEFELGNPSILQIYFRICDKGHQDDLPLPIVLNPDSISKEEKEKLLLEKVLERYGWIRGRIPGLADCEKLTTYQEAVDLVKSVAQQARRLLIGTYEALDFINDFSDYYKRLERFRGSVKVVRGYLLIDGNHKTAACVLTRKNISALELESDQDLEEIRKMVKSGELFDFKRDEKTLASLYQSYFDYIVGGLSRGDRGKFDEFLTIEERVKRLIEEEKLPNYMIRRYQLIP